MYHLGGTSIKFLIPIFLILSLGLLSACNQESGDEWQESKEEAISVGLENDGASEEAILSVEEVDGETVIFYGNSNTIGTASLEESNQGYRWYRSNSDVGFEGDSPYSTAGYDVKTKSGKNFHVVVGQAKDESIQKMSLSGDGATKELPIVGESRLFYSITENAFDQVNVEPIWNQ